MRLSNDGAIPILKLWQMIKTIVSTSTAGLVCASDAMLPSTANGLVNEFVECARAAKRGGTATPYGCCSNQHRSQPAPHRLLITYPSDRLDRVGHVAVNLRCRLRQFNYAT